MPRHAHTVLALAPLALFAACGGSSDTATPADEATTAAPITSETGAVLRRHKYRWLTYAYRTFLVGIVATAAAFVFEAFVQ